jgi:hypothetical protein
MRLIEISGQAQTFNVVVRVVWNSTPIVVKTTIDAKSQTHARAMLCHIYGASNVLSVVQQSVNEDGAKILSPDERLVKAMSDQAKRLQQQAKQIKAQNAVKKAQAQVAKAVAQSRTTSAA